MLKKVVVNDKMQSNYIYYLVEESGRSFDPEFNPELTPKEMLELGVFVDASLPLSYWRKKGWIYHEDPRGWFQWYCRYYMGRRIPPEDERQIKRWKSMKRHIGGIVKNCIPLDMECRRKQRQALLHWAYDSRKI